MPKEFKLPAVEDRPFFLLVGHESFIRKKEKRRRSYKTHPIFNIISDKIALLKCCGSFWTLSISVTISLQTGRKLSGGQSPDQRP